VETRRGTLVKDLFARLPLLLLFDNFEDKLTPEVRTTPTDASLLEIQDLDLSSLLEQFTLLKQPQGRLLFTTRYPFRLKNLHHKRLESVEVGPLTFPETRLLVLTRLVGVQKAIRPNNGSSDPLRDIWARLGGHPRALEYLNALLLQWSEDQAELPASEVDKLTEVLDHLTLILRERLARDGSVLDTEEWLERLIARSTMAGRLDTLIREVIELAAQDVLLPRLIDLLQPYERALLGSLTVFEGPFHRSALAWMTVPIDMAEAVHQISQETYDAHKKDETLDWPYYPLEVSDEAESAEKRLIRLSLISPVPPPVGAGSSSRNRPGPHWLSLHGWTRVVIRRVLHVSRDEAAQAEEVSSHRRAGLYYWWLARSTAPGPELEADVRIACDHHLRKAGDMEGALSLGNQLLAALG
jgi:hypothetical protein